MRATILNALTPTEERYDPTLKYSQIVYESEKKADPRGNNMSGKEKAYFDVTAQADPNMDIATTADKEPMTKAEEARAESSRSGADER